MDVYRLIMMTQESVCALIVSHATISLLISILCFFKAHHCDSNDVDSETVFDNLNKCEMKVTGDKWFYPAASIATVNINNKVESDTVFSE